MNERIRELAEQCTSWSEGSTWTSHEEFDKEKFAELIVQECIQTIQNESMNSNDEWEYGLRIAQGAIQTHFGVEE
jgi:hypothetical protein